MVSIKILGGLNRFYGIPTSWWNVVQYFGWYVLLPVWFPSIIIHDNHCQGFVSSLKSFQIIFRKCFCFVSEQLPYGPRQANLVLIAYASSEVQASLRIRAVSPEPSLLAHISSESRGTFRQREPDPWSHWMAGHVQLKFVMTECS